MVANELLAPFHDRMPVILAPNDYNVWLNPEATNPATLAYLFEPAPANELVATPDNPVVNNARHEGADWSRRPTAESCKAKPEPIGLIAVVFLDVDHLDC